MDHGAVTIDTGVGHEHVNVFIVGVRVGGQGWGRVDNSFQVSRFVLLAWKLFWANLGLAATLGQSWLEPICGPIWLGSYSRPILAGANLWANLAGANR